VTLEQAPEDEGYDAAVMVSGDIAFLVLSTGAYDLLVLDDYLSDRHCDFRRFTDQS
jgi:DNA-binding response OmpR family regulator